MKRAAIFVEGSTELLFVKKLLQEIAGYHHIAFNEAKWHSRTLVALTSGAGNNISYFVLLVDCEGDHQVRSAIEDQRPSLLKAGYDIVLGIRDVYPIDRNDIQKLTKGLHYKLPQANLPTIICLAIMEIEAWFLQDDKHYTQFDVNLTASKIAASGIFDPATQDAEQLPHPAITLDDLYKLVGKRYKKTRTHINRTVNSLDYANIYLNIKHKLPSLSKFIDHIDDFLT